MEAQRVLFTFIGLAIGLLVRRRARAAPTCVGGLGR